MFTNKERESINTFVCAVSIYVAETPRDHQSPLTITLSALSRTVLSDNLSRNSCIQSRRQVIFSLEFVNILL